MVELLSEFSIILAYHLPPGSVSETLKYNCSDVDVAGDSPAGGGRGDRDPVRRPPGHIGDSTDSTTGWLGVKYRRTSDIQPFL